MIKCFICNFYRGRLSGLLDRVKNIELFLIAREEEMEREKMKAWKAEKVRIIDNVHCRNESLEC